MNERDIDEGVRERLKNPGRALREFFEAMDEPGAEPMKVVSEGMKSWRLSPIDKLTLFARSVELKGKR